MKTRKSRSVRTAGRWKVVVGDNEYFIDQVTKEVVLDELKAIREDMRKRRLVTESDGDFIDKYLGIDIMNSLNYPQLFGRQFADVLLSKDQQTCYKPSVGSLKNSERLSMDKKLRKRIYRVNRRVSLNCKGSGGTYYLNSELKETLLENDENLKVHESVLTAIKTKSCKRRRTDRNSEGSSEENSDGINN